MEKLYVGLGKNSYDILIGENFFERFPEYIGEVYKGKKLFVITDSNVDRIYKNEYERMFKGFEYNGFFESGVFRPKNTNLDFSRDPMCYPNIAP